MSVILLRIVFLGYCVLLSWLLLTRDPSSVVTPGGLFDMLLGYVGWLSHFISFLLLTLLTLAARWRVPLWALATALVVYALGMEGLQSFVPSRSVELQDVVLNLAGIGVGCGLGRWVGGWRGEKSELPACLATNTTSVLAPDSVDLVTAEFGGDAIGDDLGGLDAIRIVPGKGKK